MNTECPERPEEAIWAPGTWVLGDCELSNKCCKQNMGTIALNHWLVSMPYQFLKWWLHYIYMCKYIYINIYKYIHMYIYVCKSIISIPSLLLRTSKFKTWSLKTFFSNFWKHLWLEVSLKLRETYRVTYPIPWDSVIRGCEGDCKPVRIWYWERKEKWTTK